VQLQLADRSRVQRPRNSHQLPVPRQRLPQPAAAGGRQPRAACKERRKGARETGIARAAPSEGGR
jgi:hypothetical protein